MDYIVAPFSANLSASGGTGTGLYEVHTISSSPALLSEVSSFIRQQKNTRFAGTWMLVAEWRNVRQPGGMVSVWLLHSIEVLISARTFKDSYSKLNDLLAKRQNVSVVYLGSIRFLDC